VSALLGRSPRRPVAIDGSESLIHLDVQAPLLDRLAMMLTQLESAVTRVLPLPFGTSIICVAVKADDLGIADR
jgi:hypothetical protein